VEEQIAEDDRNKLDRKATAADPQIVDGTLEVRDGGGLVSRFSLSEHDCV
jgi:hypothetical protein